MDTRLDDFARDLAALTQRFLDLGARLGDAARGLAEAGAPPSDTLVEALGEGRTQFIQLRRDVMAAAGDAEVATTVDPESLHDLEPILQAVGEALRARARLAALEDAKRQVLSTIDRVLEIVHRDDPAFATLVGAHAKAREYRAAVEALSDPEAADMPQTLEDGQVFADLLTMVEDRDGLDDDRYAQLEEIVTRAFGRSLAVAIGRGRLGFVGEIEEPPPAPEPIPIPLEPAPVDIEPEPAIASIEPESEPELMPLEEAPVLEMAEATLDLSSEDAIAPVEAEAEEPRLRFGHLEMESGEPLVAPFTEAFDVLPTTSDSSDGPIVDATPTIEMPPLELEPEPLAPPAFELEPEPPALEPEPPAPEPPAPEPEPEPEPMAVAAASEAAEEPEPVDDTAGDTGPDETAQWWLAAWARWSGWKSTLNIADAVREEIGKYPYLLSVPIQKSPEYEDGLLAYGYSLLMDHVERQNPGCVGNALNSLKPGGAQRVGDQLYSYLVTEGKLRETYAEFVRATVVGSVPEPGLWFQFRILESKDDTRIMQRPTARLGDSELSGQR